MEPKCSESRLEQRFGIVQEVQQPVCSFLLPSFDYGESQEPLQNVSKELAQQQHEESIDYNDEENIEAVQHKIQMKSKMAIENMVKSNITSDLLKHKIKEQKRKNTALEEKIKHLEEEQEELNNKEFIQNAKFTQFRRELNNIRKIVDVYNKHSTNDDSEQKTAETKITNHQAFCEKFKLDSELLKQKFDTVKTNDTKINNLKMIKQNLTDDYRMKIRSIEEQIVEVKGLIRESDEVLQAKKKLRDEVKGENTRLKEAIEVEVKNEERIGKELAEMRKLNEAFKEENKNKQKVMNADLEKIINEIKTKENELQSVCQKETNLQQDLNGIKIQNATTSHEIELLKVTLAENLNVLETENAKITQIKDEIEKISGNHVEFIAKIDADIEKFTQNYAMVQRERQDIVQETENTKKTIDTLNQQIAHHKLQLETTTTDLNGLNSTRVSLTQTKDHILQANRTLTQTLQELNANHAKCLNSYAQDKTRRETILLELKSELDKLHQEITSKNETSAAQIGDLKQSHSIQVHLKKSEHQFALEELKNEYEKFKSDLDVMMGHKRELQEELEKKTEFRNGMYAKYRKLQDELERLKGLGPGGSTSSLKGGSVSSWAGLAMDEAKSVSQPVGILKAPGNEFAVPPAPKNVTFRNSISWNSTSNTTSLESSFDEIPRNDSRHKKTPSVVSASGQSQVDDFNAMINEIFLESEAGGSSRAPGSCCSSPPTRLSDTVKHTSN